MIFRAPLDGSSGIGPGRSDRGCFPISFPRLRGPGARDQPGPVLRLRVLQAGQRCEWAKAPGDDYVVKEAGSSGG